MTEYAGKRTTLGEAEPGDVIQLLSSLKGRTGVDIPAGRIFLLRHKVNSNNSGVPLVDPAAHFTNVLLYSSTFNTYTYRGVHVPVTTEVNILTGRKAASLWDQYVKKLLNGEARLHVTSSLCTSGADPEVFVRHGDGSLFPAWEFLPSKQGAPKDDNGPVYWDGFQAEMAPPGGNCCEGLTSRIAQGLCNILHVARARDPKATLSLDSVVDVPPHIMDEAAREYISLGCSPSKNAYGAQGITVEEPRGLLKRFAGGHIHLGGTYFHTNPEAYVKAFDRTVGIASVAMYEGIDNPVRRQFYGLAGEFRLPSHGIEYRTLSNAWLCHPALTYWTFDMIRVTAACVYYNIPILPQLKDEEVQEIINSSDVLAARAVCAQYAPMWKVFVQNWYGVDSHWAWTATERLLQQGVREVLPTYGDIEGNWNLKVTNYPANFITTSKKWEAPVQVEKPQKARAVTVGDFVVNW